jgi:Terminase large subunit, T4likevirus-type, N-terminal
MNVTIPLYGEQKTILHDWLTTNKHCIDIVPVGSGKTFLASIALPIFATDPHYHHGKDIIYSAPTGAMIKSLIWEPLKKSCIEYYGLVDAKDINNSELTIRFKNGVFIRCKSAEQRENLRGLNVGVWIADEAALYTQDTLQEITNRLRPKVGQPDTQGRLIVISTPNGTGPLYDLFKLALENPEKYIVHHYNYEQMRSGNRQFIEEQKRIISPLKFNQDYMCQFESVADMFYYTWDRHKYCNEVVDRGGDLYTFHDFNKRVMCAVVAQVTKPGSIDGKIEVLKSYAIPDCSTEGIASAIREDFPRRRINSIIDMSGTQMNRDTTSPFGVTDKIILEKYGFTIVNTRKSNPLVTDTDNTSNAFIQRGGLVVKPDDKFLLEALGTYHFEDASRKRLVKYTEQKYAHIDGLGDAIRYGIHYLFPITHESIGIPEYVGMDQRLANRARPGTQHMPDSPLYPGGPTWEEIINGEQVEDHMIWS